MKGASYPSSYQKQHYHSNQSGHPITTDEERSGKQQQQQDQYELHELHIDVDEEAIQQQQHSDDEQQCVPCVDPHDSNSNSGDIFAFLRSSTGEIGPIQQMTAASGGAMITALLTTPLDVVKTRLQSTTASPRPQHQHQTATISVKMNALRSAAAAAATTTTTTTTTAATLPQFTGTFDGFKKIIQYEGVTGLWRGLPPTLLMSVPSTGIYYTIYELLKDTFTQHSTSITSYQAAFFAGSIARIIAVTITCPLELIRTNVQSQGAHSKGIISTIRLAVARGGIKSMWTGLGPTIFRDAPFSAVYWASYDIFRDFYTPLVVSHETLQAELRRRGQPQPNSNNNNASVSDFRVNFLAGASGGVVAAAVTNPIDVVKTRIQAQLNQTSTKHTPSTFQALKTIIQEEGVRGFTKGMVPRLAKVGPSCAIMISTYELFKKHIFSSPSATAAPATLRSQQQQQQQQPSGSSSSSSNNNNNNKRVICCPPPSPPPASAAEM